MEYQKKYFDPKILLQDFRDNKVVTPENMIDRRDGLLYLYNEDIILAVNVAIATGRPLLIKGPAGCGKSSLAYNIAKVLNRKYYEFVVTSRSKAKDLMWSFDAVRRLGDAQAKLLKLEKDEEVQRTYYRYIEPKQLWWIFDPNSARRRGLNVGEEIWFPEAKDLAKEISNDLTGAVLLIDEIDKADPDFPNNLLVPIGSLEFTVDEIQYPVTFQSQKDKFEVSDLPLIIITSNEERELPTAFIRRCVILRLDYPTRENLINIATATIEDGSNQKSIFEKVIDVFEMESDHEQKDVIRVSIAEYLDTVQAAIQLKLAEKEDLLEKLLNATIFKEKNK